MFLNALDIWEKNKPGKLTFFTREELSICVTGKAAGIDDILPQTVKLSM